MNVDFFSVTVAFGADSVTESEEGAEGARMKERIFPSPSPSSCGIFLNLVEERARRFYRELGVDVLRTPRRMWDSDLFTVSESVPPSKALPLNYCASAGGYKVLVFIWTVWVVKRCYGTTTVLQHALSGPLPYCRVNTSQDGCNSDLKQFHILICSIIFFFFSFSTYFVVNSLHSYYERESMKWAALVESQSSSFLLFLNLVLWLLSPYRSRLIMLLTKSAGRW